MYLHNQSLNSPETAIKIKGSFICFNCRIQALKRLQRWAGSSKVPVTQMYYNMCSIMVVQNVNPLEDQTFRNPSSYSEPILHCCFKVIIDIKKNVSDNQKQSFKKATFYLSSTILFWFASLLVFFVAVFLQFVVTINW